MPPLYSDQPALVEVTTRDFDGTLLTNVDLTQVTVRVIYPASIPPNQVVLAETAMTWNAPTSTWQYLWYLPADAGAYTLEVQGYAVGESAPTPSYKRVSVSGRPFP